MPAIRPICFMLWLKGLINIGRDLNLFLIQDYDSKWPIDAEPEVRRLTAKSREVSKPLRDYTDRVALEFNRHHSSAAADEPVKFQSDWKSLHLNLAASGLHEILR